MTMQIEHKDFLDPRAREGVALILDLLLPGTDTQPSGQDAGAHEEWIDRALQAEPRLEESLRRVADLAADHGACTYSDLERWAGEDLESVVSVLQASYYMSPVVKQALHYPGQARRPISSATTDETWSEDLVAPVRDRGAIYVPTPVQPENAS